MEELKNFPTKHNSSSSLRPIESLLGSELHEVELSPTHVWLVGSPATEIVVVAEDNVEDETGTEEAGFPNLGTGRITGGSWKHFLKILVAGFGGALYFHTLGPG